MICTVDSYIAVRGMNRREAGEDFYFLNKLAKLGDIGQIHATTVYPSARPSRRVPSVRVNGSTGSGKTAE